MQLVIQIVQSFLIQLQYIDGNASKSHIMIFDENEIFTVILNIFLIRFSINCQRLVPNFECKVYQIGKNRSSKHSVASLF